jgi:hypothetical protein
MFLDANARCTMYETIVIREGDALRYAAEAFIRNVYFVQYGAQLQTFPSRIVALVDDSDEIVCAAGVRLEDDGFFSERYLDSSVEQALGAASKRTIARGVVLYADSPPTSLGRAIGSPSDLSRRCGLSSDPGARKMGHVLRLGAEGLCDRQSSSRA